MADLADSYGRVHRDLRISVTDRCNFRCVYCMPEEEMRWLDRADLLSFEEIERLARLFVGRYGFDGIRLTGGEPTLRARLPQLVRRLAELPVDLSLTTNGANLALIAGDLAGAGLRRINISCDSLRRERFQALTRRDRLGVVLDGVDAALAAGLDPVKLNVVMMRGVNDDEILDFASFGRAKGVTVRFIEFMPLDADRSWTRDQVVTSDEIRSTIAAVHPLEPVRRGAEPAERFRYRDGGGEVGVVASVTRPFCGNCERVRLSADGKLRNCLFALEESDLRAVLRNDGSDDDLARVIEGCVQRKWRGHSINQLQFVRPPLSMSQIGG